MTTHVVADETLGGMARRQWELTRRVMEGSLDPAYVMAALQELIEGKYALTDPFARYTDHLLSLEQQLERLQRYNSQYWENRLTEAELAAVVTASEHTQHVTDLEFLHVEFGSREETAEMWWRVYVGEQPDSWRWDELKLDPEHFQLLVSNVRTYEPGIHVVRINLVAHWELQDGRTLEQVRERAVARDQIMAQLEVMSAYGLHTELFREQDGENLPYSDMAGTVVTVPGGSLPHALCVNWVPFSRARFYAHWVGGRTYLWAAPVLRE